MWQVSYCNVIFLKAMSQSTCQRKHLYFHQQLCSYHIKENYLGKIPIAIGKVVVRIFKPCLKFEAVVSDLFCKWETGYGLESSIFVISSSSSIPTSVHTINRKFHFVRVCSFTSPTYTRSMILRN